MNLAEALNAAVPEITRPRRDRFYRIDPSLVAREQIEAGEPMIMVFKRENGNLYRFPPLIWQVLQEFDGTSSFEEIAERIENFFPLTAENLKSYADGLADSDFWYKSPQEKNAALHHKHQEDRRKHIDKKSKYGDVSRMQFSSWDPDRLLTAFYERLRFVYSRWFTLLTLAMFAVMAVIFVAYWDEIGRDTLKYYTFTEKNFSDLAEFWLLFFFIGFFHESAHGITCKHYGGEVHSMGFHLIYLTPAFYIDVSEAWVYGGRWQRLATMLAGIWVEMMFCSAATVVWWGTPPGTFTHEFAYKVMLITGVAVIVVNANPLIKLDGYFMFCELFQTPEIKDRSTAFLSTWTRNKIFRLPVEIDYVPAKRQWLYVIYGLASGAYSYMLLFTVAKFAYNVFSRYSPEWGFVPGIGIFLLIFKSRIKTFLRFMKTVYLDKREWFTQRMTPARLAAAGIALFLLMVAPVWPDRIEARSSIEAAQRATIRAAVPGYVQEMRVREGDSVNPGQVLVVLRNPEMQSALALAKVDRMAAEANFSRAQLSYASLGPASAKRNETLERERLAKEDNDRLVVVSPIDGVVTSKNTTDLVGAYRDSGDVLVDISNENSPVANAYVAEFDLRHLSIGQQAAVFLDGMGKSYSGTVIQISEEASPVAPGLMHTIEYKGLQPPKYYVTKIKLSGDPKVRDFSTATAKIRVGRISALALAERQVRDFVGRKVW